MTILGLLAPPWFSLAKNQFSGKTYSYTIRPCPLGRGEAAAAHVAELAAADDGLDRDVLRVDLLGELLHGGLRERRLL